MSNKKKKKAKKKRQPTQAVRPQPDWFTAEDHARSQAIEAQRYAVGRAELRAAVDRHLTLAVEIEDAKEGIAFIHDGSRVAYLWKDKAAARFGKRPIHGDFLQSGSHWKELSGLLQELQVGHIPSPELLHAQLILTSLPEWLSVEKRAMALAASKRIRTRARAFDRPVLLENAGDQIRFDPIRSRSGTAEEIPFSFRQAGAEAIDGALRLQTSTDPLAIASPESTDEADLVRAWVVALVAFADLTCADVIDGSPTLEALEKTTYRGSRRSHPRLLSVPVRTRGRRSAFSRSLTPVGMTARHAASYVSGHRRRLRSGQCRSEEARLAARAVGIQLGAAETWVQPHARGLPPDFVLCFNWQAPRLITSW